MAAATHTTIDRAGFEVLRGILTRYVIKHLTDFNHALTFADLSVRVGVDDNRLRITTDQWGVTMLGPIGQDGRAPIKFTGMRAAFERDLFALKLAL